MVVESTVDLVDLRVYVEDLLRAGHKQLALLGPRTPDFSEIG